MPLEARILAVADVWGALTSDRVYRRAWQSAAALEQMWRDAGTGFDPRCIDALSAILDRATVPSMSDPNQPASKISPRPESVSQSFG